MSCSGWPASVILRSWNSPVENTVVPGVRTPSYSTFATDSPYYNEDSEHEGEADLVVAKHRNGGLGKVTLTFRKEYPKFMNFVGEDRFV